MKPEQLEIERLRKEVAKLKAERDILKKDRRLLCEGRDMNSRSLQSTVRSGPWRGSAKRWVYRVPAFTPG